MEEINLSTNDDITLFTDEEQVAVDNINQKFTQQSKLKGLVREFTIFNDIQCYQTVKLKHGGKHKFRINLSHLDPKPKRDFVLADNWLITAVISAILSFLLIYIGWFSAMQVDQHIFIIITALCISFCFIAFLFAMLKTQDRFLYYSQCGRAPILELINNNPDHESFTEFINLLSSHVIKAQSSADLNPTEKLVMELKELRRLKDETVIPESDYEQAKQKIFRNKAFSSQDSF
jgi:hypothetical protein